MRISIRQLDVYRALYLHRSVGKAAQSLNLTQPAVTKSLYTLEGNLNIKLFEINRQGCVPTPEGELLYKYATQAHESYSSFERVARDLNGLKSGSLRVVTNPALSQGIISGIISKFIQFHPGVSMEVKTVPSRLIPEMVGSNQVDVGLILFPFSDNSTMSETMQAGSFICTVPQGHPLSNREDINASILASFDYIAFSQRTKYGQLLSECFEHQKTSYRPLIEVEVSSTALALSRKLGVPAIVDNLILHGMSLKNISLIPLLDSPAIPIGLCCPKLYRSPVLTSSFIKITKETLQDIDIPGIPTWCAI